MSDQGERIRGHGGVHAIAAAHRHGATAMFTLSGGHVFPIYDAAVHAQPPVRIVDVRHEQTAVFAAEATARLTRRAGLAVVTAGPGVTNTVSAVTTAHFNGAPVVVLAGRAPDSRWGAGSLQEIDHPPLLAPVTKAAWTEHEAGRVAASVDRAFALATTPHRGPVFLDMSLEALFGEAEAGMPTGPRPDSPTAGDARTAPGTGSPNADGAPQERADLARVADLLDAAQRPVLVLGSDVWLAGADNAARQAAEHLRLPVIVGGQGRGVLPRGHNLLVTRARSLAFREADLVIVVGAPLDFRLGHGSFGPADSRAQVVHLMDTPVQIAAHCALAGSAAGDLHAMLTDLAATAGAGISRSTAAARAAWLDRLRAAARAAVAADLELLTADSDPIHPGRIYGELMRQLADDAVIIGDGGDFVSFAGRHVEPALPGRWLDPGPFGCLGTGLGYAIGARVAHPAGQVVLLLGDGAAGFSLLDVDTLVRHHLPVVIVCGNNGAWDLEKHPMRALYGYDVAADLQPGCRYDEVVRALGGDGELVTEPAGIGPALRRAFTSGVPYLVNVVTDPEAAYPRSTSLT